MAKPPSKLVPKGKVAEYRFAAEIMDRGMMVSWPSSDTWPYDCIVDAGGIPHRVQVKSTEKLVSGSTSSVELHLRTNGAKKRAYSKKDTDFIVVHLFATGSWYIFPVQDVKASVTIKPYSASCKHKKYMDAWKLFEGPQPKQRKKK